MKRHVTAVGVLLLIFVTTGMLQARPGQSSPVAAQAAGELLVRFVPEAGREQRDTVLKSIGGELKGRIDDLNVEIVRVPQLGGEGVQAAAQLIGALEQNPLVEHAQPNYIYSVTSTTPSKIHLPLVFGLPTYAPNDPLLDLQYGWDSISAYAGWAYDRGSNKVVVAVVDTGIQLSHPDLSSKLVPGYDFVTDDAIADDLNGHGTHVAGTVGAITNNGIGVAGACPNCLLMPVRVLDEYGRGSTVDVADGLVFAANKGAKVINLSLGGSRPDSVLEWAVNYAWSKGAVVACAAGNEGHLGNPINYPAYYTNCLAVGAVDSSDQPAYYSEYGTWVDVAAPGSDIYSTYVDHDGNSVYASLNGTSMATPHVAGVAGILAGQGLTNSQIRARIQSRADAIPGTGTYWSNGRLNLAAAVRN